MVSAGTKKRKQVDNKTKAVETTPRDWLHQVAFRGLALLLFFPPYFRGLFFAPEQEKALIFAALVFWVTFLWRRLQGDHRLLATPLDWFALALPAAYILSAFVAVNKGLAIEEVVKNILYFLTFWSVSRLVRNERDAESILKIIYASAIGVALAGLATATGLIHIKDGFNEGRIFSTFQYPNALASYLSAVVFMGVYLWDKVSNRKEEACDTVRTNLRSILEGWNVYSYLIVCGNFLLLTVLWGTKSRGGLLVFFLVFFVYLLRVGAQRRLYSILHFGYLGAAALLVIYRFVPLAMKGNAVQAWLWVVAGLVFAAAGQALFFRLNQWVSVSRLNSSSKLNFVSGTLILVAITAAVIFLTNQPVILKQAAGFEYLRNALDRIYYMETAAEMIKDRPLLGWGGGGWQEAYRSYMDYLYTTRQVHSFYFQVGVETGITGLLSVGTIWLYFLYLAHRSYHDSKENYQRKYLIWTLATSFLVIAGHALIDFDLSMSALTLVLWSLFGIISGLGHKKPAREEKSTNLFRRLSVGITSGAVILLLIGCFCLVHSRTLMVQGIKFIKFNQVSRGVEYIEQAVSQNPFRGDYRLTLSQVYSLLNEKDKAMAEAGKAVALSQYDIDPRFNLAQIAMAQDKYETAAESAAAALELVPNEVGTYEKSMEIFNSLGEKELENGNIDQAKDYFENSIRVSKTMLDYKGSLSEKAKRMWQGPELTLTPQIMLRLGVAHYWLGRFSDAEALLLEAAKDNNLKGEAFVYLALLKEKERVWVEAGNYLEQSTGISSKFEQKYMELSALPVVSR